VIAELAIDADEPFYRAHGSSTTAVQNDITGILNAVDVIYNRDVGIEHQVTTIIIRTVPRYTTNNPNGLLTQFQNVWNNNHTDIQRDVAHLFSGRNASSVVGLAHFAEVCNRSQAYGVSWTLFSLNTILRAALTTHELGHNWGADHCDGFFDCGLMCTQLPGCNFNLTSFGSFALLQIGLFKNSRTCLTTPPAPTVMGISPSAVTSFEPGEVTLTGSELDKVSSVTVGGVPANFTIVGGDTLRFTPPSPLTISTHEVIVSNNTGASTIDLSVMGNHPSVVEPPVITIRTIPAIYRVHTDRDWHVLLVASLSNVPSIIPEVTLGLGNQFSDMVILPLFADSSGTAEIQLTIPPIIPSTFSYWQAVAFDPANLTFPLEVSELVVVLVH
jgi:hypothetical protein